MSQAKSSTPHDNDRLLSDFLNDLNDYSIKRNKDYFVLY